MPYEVLMRALARIGRVRFEVEYQNNARDEESHPWARERIKTFDLNTVRSIHFRAVMVADPAKGKGHGQNEQAWALICQHPETGAIYVPAAWRGKLPDTQIVDEWFDAYLSWNAWVPGGVLRFLVESNGSMLLAPILHRLSLERRVNLPVKELIAQGDKADRDSAAIDPLITYGALYIEEGLPWLLDDLADFPDGDLDVIDCLAHGVNELRLPRTVEGSGSGWRRLALDVKW
jgi:hypothetical protein